MNKNITIASALLVSLFASQSMAKVSNAELAKIGTELTPIGAEMAGNAAGTIPAWTGGLNSSGDLKSKDSGRPDHPFADEKPLFIITKANLEQYKENLSAGQIAMLNKYPEFAMPVYKTHRSAAYPQSIYDIAKKNALNTELVAGGNGLTNFDTSYPFIIPKDGNEVIWNHLTRYRGGAAKRFSTTIPVQKNGSFVPLILNDTLVWPEFLVGGRDNKKDDNILFYYLQQFTAPAIYTGTALLVHDTVDQVKDARRAWVYNSGQRRVRRAPNVAYDGPATGVEGLRVTDDYDMYNGAPDRYNWKLVGKKELYIPYNSYNMLNTDLSYDDLLQQGHMTPEHLRYELHRVWVVEATLKEGERHIYAKRVFHIDEDSWQASVIDKYDGRGQLWRMSEAHGVQFYDVDTYWFANEVNYDLDSGRYLVTGLANQEPKFLKWGVKLKRKEFSTSALRRMGR